MTTRLNREVVEGPQVQGEDERVIYTVDVENWGSNPTGIVFELKDSAGNDVTTTYCTGSPSAVSSTYINTPTIHSLVAGSQYRAELLFVVNGQTLETFFIIIAEE